MKVLFAGLRYDNGDPARGSSYEWHNLVAPWRWMADQVLFLDTGPGLGPRRAQVQQTLLDAVARHQPDLLFTVLYQDELAAATLEHVTHRSETHTVNWFCDDHWRFGTYTRRWAPRFDLAVTTSRAALQDYAAAGLHNVHLSQWAAQPFEYRPLGLAKSHDVTFVGQPHGDRRQIIDALGDRGVPVMCWGHGWPNGRLSQEGMVRVFNSSRVNLNLAASSTVSGGLATRLPFRMARWYQSNPTGLLQRAGARTTRLLARGGRGTPLAPQIKGRTFEIPSCGSLLLSTPAQDLGSYYVPGREIVVAETVDAMAEEARRLLRDDGEREAIAARGLARTLAEHTYFHRFAGLLETLGLPARPPQHILTGSIQPVPVQVLE